MRPEKEFLWGDISKTSLAVCIPAFNEDSVIPVLESLRECTVSNDSGIFIFINASEYSDDRIKSINETCYEEAVDFIKSTKYPYPVWLGIHNSLPSKKAGVGLARKILMDSAVGLIEKNKRDQILLCLDADCEVSKNYLSEVSRYFKAHSKIQTASIYFEHRQSGNPAIDEGIAFYELHLRYLKLSLEWAGFPWYYHTIGSSMAVRLGTYIKCGGMNVRQAGEDFYFLHKLMPLGFGEIRDCVVYPAARLSDRVPFGTGKSLIEYQNQRIQHTYSADSFRQLKILFSNLSAGIVNAQNNWDKDLDSVVKSFFRSEGIESAMSEALQNSSEPSKTNLRFLKWFSGFRIIRYLHFLRNYGYPDVEVTAAARVFLNNAGIKVKAENIFFVFRELDRNGWN